MICLWEELQPKYIELRYNTSVKKMKEYKYHIGLNLRIYPSDKQKKIIKMNGGASRYIYNKLVADNNEMYELKKSSSFSIADRNRLEFLESIHKTKSNMLIMIPFLTQKEIDSDMIDNAIQNYKMAWNQYNKVKGASVPTFHKKDNTYFYKTSNHYGKIRNDGLKDGSIYFIDNNHINLPKIGRIRFKGSKKLVDKVLNFPYGIRVGSTSIEMDNLGLCYISISLASDYPFYDEYDKTNSSVGIDLNLSNFLADSNDNIIDSPKFLKKTEAKLKKEQKKLSRKYEAAKKDKRKYYECKNYQDQRLKVAKFHKHVSNQRKDFYNVLANNLVKNHDYIFAEDLKIRNMIKNHKLAKAISDSSWRSFLTILEWTALKRNKTFILVDPKNTTQMCSICGVISDEKIILGIEEWTCPHCGTYHIRDINAAINIKNKGLSLV